MPAKIEYKKSVLKDLKRIGMPKIERIILNLEKALKENPHEGIPLKGEFEGLFRLKIGNYRIIYAKTREGVLILRIGTEAKSTGNT